MAALAEPCRQLITSAMPPGVCKGGCSPNGQESCHIWKEQLQAKHCPQHGGLQAWQQMENDDIEALSKPEQPEQADSGTRMRSSSSVMGASLTPIACFPGEPNLPSQGTVLGLTGCSAEIALVIPQHLRGHGGLMSMQKSCLVQHITNSDCLIEGLTSVTQALSIQTAAGQSWSR